MARLLTVRDAASNTVATLAPYRGAIVTSFAVAGRELLYLDRSTFDEPSKNVRGGVPVLFPSPGKLDRDGWRTAEHAYEMKQHGFARTQSWAVDASRTTESCARLTLDSNPQTLLQYPFEFRFELEFEITARRLAIRSTVRNMGARVMPFALGYHPYFLVGDKQHAEVDIAGERAFDNVSKRIGLLSAQSPRFDLLASELDLHVLDSPRDYAELALSADERVRIDASRDFSTWVVWTVAGKDYVCVEPWTAPGNALNTGERLIHVAPGAAHESWIEISYSKRA